MKVRVRVKVWVRVRVRVLVRIKVRIKVRVSGVGLRASGFGSKGLSGLGGNRD